MEKILVFLLFVFAPILTLSQNHSGWSLRINFGLQEHDKRLFNYSERETLLQLHTGMLGTYQFGIVADRKIFSRRQFEIIAGAGVSLEINTFTRPFDHFYKRDFPQILILPHTDRYYKSLIQLPIAPNFKIREDMGFSIELLPQFSFLTIADNSNNSPIGAVSWWMLEFNSIELNPSVVYDTGKFIFGLRYRAFQIKKIDKIIFNDIIKDPRVGQDFETENPFKIWFSIGYKL